MSGRRTSAIYSRSRSTRPPPSSFHFPFQAYPGNPDPISGYLSRLERPYPPFMAEPGLYSTSFSALPRSPSTHSFRTPFLSPVSRPGSSLWFPPSHSSLALPLKSRTPLPSTRLPQKLSRSEKPWLSTPDSGARLSWWITFACILLGLAGAGALCYLGATEAHKLSPNQLCLVLDDSFSGGTLDDTVWTPVVQLGSSSGSPNGIPSEFSMTTDSPANLHITNNQLYLTPTLTTSQIQALNVFSGNYTLPGCTATSTNNKTNSCSVRANPLLGTVINPVQGARITTKGKKELRYGRVEVRAQLPQGDWLWPSITLYPSSPAYNPAFPASGLMTLLSSRGNSPSTYFPTPSPNNTKSNIRYDGGGSNSITSSLAYAPLLSLYHQLTGSFILKRSSFTSSFHTYVMEWDETWMRFYVDSRLTATLTVDVSTSKKSFWNQAGFPATAANGTIQGGEENLVVVDNPYEDAGPNAPFDQPFYVSLQLTAGGTDGWFPDEVGGKPWFDDSQTAMSDFARAQDEWSKTWPDDEDERSFRIDSVKIWEKC